MRCSRVALSMLLAVLLGAMIACGPTNARRVVAADIGSPEPPSTETPKWADRYENATDWRDAYSPDGKQPWANRYDYGDHQSAYGYVEEPRADTDDALDTAESGHSYESNEASQQNSEDDDEAEYTYHYGGYGPAYEYGEESNAETDNTSDTSQTEYVYEYEHNDDANAATDEPDEHAYSDPYTDPVTQYPDYESAYSYESEYSGESEYGESRDADPYRDEEDNNAKTEINEPDEHAYSYPYSDPASECPDDESEYAGESAYSYQAEDSGESQYSESRRADPYRDEEDDGASEGEGYQGYSEAYPSEEHAYDDGDSEYTYQYEYSYPEEKYGATNESQDAPKSEYDAPSAYEDTDLYPYEYRGYDPYQYSDDDNQSQQMFDAEAASETEVGFQTQPDLSAWLPGELLTESDWETVRRLERLGEEPPAARRAALNDYLRQLGYSAMDFALRLEEATGAAVLDLAADPPGAAAMLAGYRLAERGELTTDQAIEMLRRGLEDLPEHWSEEVYRVTTQRVDWSGSGSAQNSILDVLASWASASWPSMSWSSMSWSSMSVGELGNTFRRISSRISALDWSLLSAGPHEGMPSDGPSSNWKRF